MRLVAVFGVLVVISCRVAASDWQVVAMPNEKGLALVEFDQESLVRTAVDVTVWSRFTHRQVKPIPTKPGGKYSVRLDLIKFHCATRNYEPIESVYYDADGVQQHVRHYQRELFYIIPGSLSEQVLETVCKTK